MTERYKDMLAGELMFESLRGVISFIMSNPGGRTAVEVMVDLCYQKHPTSLKEFVHISKVKR